MVKWADYLISKVKYSKERRYIQEVKILEDNESNNPRNLGIKTREWAVDKLKQKYKIRTAPSSNGKLNKGPEIEIVLINNKEYIKTIPNNKEEDNLGELPEL